jgi:heterotetrameric sarcosine oxidase delta subunit
MARRQTCTDFFTQFRTENRFPLFLELLRRTNETMAYMINCPHCGRRTTDEFYIKGDATKARPTAIGDDTLDQWHDYVNIRENVRGRIAEYWHHTGGCRQWLVVERDSVTHDVYGVTPAQDWKPAAARTRSPALKTAARKAPARKAGGKRS